MKKYTLNFGQFRQYDKKFITAENGIDTAAVNSVAFLGEVLYFTAEGSLYEYNDGKAKKLSVKAERIFGKDGRVFVSTGRSLGELKGGKVKKLADFDCDIKDVSVAMDK